MVEFFVYTKNVAVRICYSFCVFWVIMASANMNSVLLVLSSFKKVRRFFQLWGVCVLQLLNCKFLFFLMCFCTVKVTKNNLFVNLLNFNGRRTILCLTIANKNLGCFNSNSFNFVSRLVGEYVGLVIKKLSFTWLVLHMENVSKVRRAFLAGLLKYSFILILVEDRTAVPFNGCRLKKRKR